MSINIAWIAKNLRAEGIRKMLPRNYSANSLVSESLVYHTFMIIYVNSISWLKGALLTPDNIDWLILFYAPNHFGSQTVLDIKI